MSEEKKPEPMTLSEFDITLEDLERQIERLRHLHMPIVSSNWGCEAIDFLKKASKILQDVRVTIEMSKEDIEDQNYLTEIGWDR